MGIGLAAGRCDTVDASCAASLPPTDCAAASGIAPVIESAASASGAAPNGMSPTCARTSPHLCREASESSWLVDHCAHTHTRVERREQAPITAGAHTYRRAEHAQQGEASIRMPLVLRAAIAACAHNCAALDDHHPHGLRPVPLEDGSGDAGLRGKHHPRTVPVGGTGRSPIQRCRRGSCRISGI